MSKRVSVDRSARLTNFKIQFAKNEQMAIVMYNRYFKRQREKVGFTQTSIELRLKTEKYGMKTIKWFIFKESWTFIGYYMEDFIFGWRIFMLTGILITHFNKLDCNELWWFISYWIRSFNWTNQRTMKKDIEKRRKTTICNLNWILLENNNEICRITCGRAS